MSDASLFEFLFGYGFGYGEIVTSSVNSSLTSLHNAYLQMPVEFGIVGLGLFLALHILSLRNVWRRRDKFAVYAVGLIVFLLVVNLSTTTPDNFIYWIILGYTLAIRKWGNENHN